MTPFRITRTGRDHTWAAPMTDAQRERAEGRWHDETGRPWTAWRIAGDMLGMVAVFAAVLLLWWVW